MKKLSVLMMTIMTIFVLSCNKNDASQSQSVKKAADLVASNEYIDADLTNVAKGKPLAAEEQVKAKAATYRFFSHVHLKNGLYVVSDLHDAGSINISSSVYSTLLNSLNQTNATILSLRAQGKRVDVPEISDKYLRSLLK